MTNSVEPCSVARSGRPVSAVISAEANQANLAVVAQDSVLRNFADHQLLVAPRLSVDLAAEVPVPARLAISPSSNCSASIETTTARSVRFFGRECRARERSRFEVQCDFNGRFPTNCIVSLKETQNMASRQFNRRLFLQRSMVVTGCAAAPWYNSATAIGRAGQ